jgi:anti-sigma factor RsiW
MLSVYLDGELPSPWKEKMEKHLALCVSCRGRLDAYREISHQLQGGEASFRGAVSAGDPAPAKERVWLRLQNREAAAARRPAPGIWGRSVSIPLPAAAAAAAVLCIALAAVWFRPGAGAPQIQDMTAAGMVDVRGMVPVSDMNGVFQYLGNQDTGDIVILRLPESRNFMSSGEPTILKAAELPARVPGGPGSAPYPSGRNTPR